MPLLVDLPTTFVRRCWSHDQLHAMLTSLKAQCMILLTAGVGRLTKNIPGIDHYKSRLYDHISKNQLG
jgi:hypothetical protein